jgi:hypothetical protein
MNVLFINQTDGNKVSNVLYMFEPWTSYSNSIISRYKLAS